MDILAVDAWLRCLRVIQKSGFFRFFRFYPGSARIFFPWADQSLGLGLCQKGNLGFSSEKAEKISWQFISHISLVNNELQN
jgi:hypothetical protein